MFCLCVKKSNKKRQFHKRNLALLPSKLSRNRSQQALLRCSIQNLLEPATQPLVNMRVCSACAGYTQPGGPKRAMRGAVVLHNRQMTSPPPPPRTYHQERRCTIPTHHIVRVRNLVTKTPVAPCFATVEAVNVFRSARFPDQLRRM